MASLKRIHWHAPTSMTAALVCAVALSLGHHFFYASLDGQLTPAGSYHVVGKSKSKQQFNTAIGTAFAFVVKSALAVAITLAYVQVFWHTVNTARRSPTLTELDTLSALGNVLGLFNVADRWRHPLLFGLALIFWCAPIATIITPATLSVSSGLRKSFSMMQVPQFDFTTLDYSATMHMAGSVAYSYSGSSQSLQKIASAVLARGQILPINPPSSNTSWTLEFWGPALHCQEVQGAERDAIWVNIWNSYQNATRSWAFLAWVPSSNGSTAQRMDLPFTVGSDDPALYPDTLSYGVDIALYLAVLPNMLDVTPSGAQNRLFDAMDLTANSLVNTSYSKAFSYPNGLQNAQVLWNTSQSSPPVSALGELYMFDVDPEPEFYLNTTYKYTFLQAEPPTARSCFVDPVPLQQVAYQSVFDAFGILITGYVRRNDFEVYGLNATTMSMRTILAQSKEIAAIRAWKPSVSYGTLAPQSDLQTVLQHTEQSTLQGLTNNLPKKIQCSLKDMLEKAFENITISILSDPDLQPNASSQFGPSLKTNVTLESTVNFYVYDQTTLWIAYGLAILFSTLAVIVGLVFLVISGASYDTTLSTIVRVAKAAELTVELKDEEGAGCQPLPDKLAKARLVVGLARLPPLSAQLEMQAWGPHNQKPSGESNSLLVASEESSMRNRRH
ncbi:hypothetical protein LTS10_013037 [Elasticomyces elasticus]|nr:hypothetical protein LTS10_013037 [Elasticomyces elasticus]